MFTLEEQRSNSAMLRVLRMCYCVFTYVVSCVSRVWEGDVTCGGQRHTFMSTAGELYKEHGARGFLRGVRPRMMSVAIWGTTMVTTYEFLKRTSRIDSDSF